MTEKEKALNGYLYKASDNTLTNERSVCKELCFEYNKLRPSQTTERNILITKIIGKINGPFLIEQPFICDYGYNIESKRQIAGV